MDTSPPIQDVLAGEKISVGVGEIDEELIALWQATASTPTDEARTAVTLVRVLNLVTYVEGDERADEANAVIRRITGRHPCRSILMIRNGDEASPPGMSAWISAHCQLPGESGKQICSEQITISAQGTSIHNMHALALNLLISDTPVFLWWTASQPFDDDSLSHMGTSIDRLILDSTTFVNPVESLIRMAGLGEVRPSHLRRAMSDFSWTRLAPWREATAQFFDPPNTRRYINGISKVQIDYAAPAPGQPANPIPALLYAGWLASRLDWKFEGALPGKDGATFALNLRYDGQPITVRIGPEPAECTAPGSMTALRLFANRPGPGTFSMTCYADEKFATTSVGIGPGTPTERRMIYLEPDEADLLNQELEMFDHDKIYEQALQLAALFARGSAPGQRWSIMA